MTVMPTTTKQKRRKDGTQRMVMLLLKDIFSAILTQLHYVAHFIAMKPSVDCADRLEPIRNAKVS
uniref:Uncharacterized protein n=1 Tax=Rhizophora mucronata TaxID=61149 RepID=A0A2P2KBP0_RHIMU